MAAHNVSSGQPIEPHTTLSVILFPYGPAEIGNFGEFKIQKRVVNDAFDQAVTKLFRGSSVFAVEHSTMDNPVLEYVGDTRKLLKKVKDAENGVPFVIEKNGHAMLHHNSLCSNPITNADLPKKAERADSKVEKDEIGGMVKNDNKENEGGKMGVGQGDDDSKKGTSGIAHATTLASLGIDEKMTLVLTRFVRDREDPMKYAEEDMKANIEARAADPARYIALDSEMLKKFAGLGSKSEGRFKVLYTFPGPVGGHEALVDEETGRVVRPAVITTAAHYLYTNCYTVCYYYIHHNGYAKGYFEAAFYDGCPLLDIMNLIRDSPFPNKHDKRILDSYSRILAKAVGDAHAGIPITESYLVDKRLVDLPADLEAVFESRGNYRLDQRKDDTEVEAVEMEIAGKAVIQKASKSQTKAWDDVYVEPTPERPTPETPTEEIPTPERKHGCFGCLFS